MSPDQYRAALRKRGWTVREIVGDGRDQALIVEGRTPGSFASVPKPENLTPEEREEALARFFRVNDL